MGMVVVAALGLVEGLLGARLAVIGLDTAGEAVGGVGEGLLDLLLGGLGGVRSDFLLSLCIVVSDPIYAMSLVDKMSMEDVLVEKSLRPASDMLID